jgi:hypothetical protein
VQAAGSALFRRGVRVVVVTSGNHRAGAHAFYGKRGYTCTGRRYKKARGRPAREAGDSLRFGRLQPGAVL